MVTIKERIPPAWRKCLARAPLAIGLMALIFAQSATAGLVGDLGVLSIVLSNLGHAVTFGLLAALLWWALRPVTGRALPIAVAVALLYGISDEIHQSFVAARDAADDFREARVTFLEALKGVGQAIAKRTRQLSLVVGIESLEDLLGRAAQLGAKLFIEIVWGFEHLAQLIDDLVQ